MDNILITYRQGTGNAGNNVPVYSFETLKNPHALIDHVRQPLTSSGGQDRENTEQIRKNAPSHLKALGRGVSLSDFEHIAKTTPGIWHAKAFKNIERGGRKTQIDIVLVPTDGAPIGGIKPALETRLGKLAPPYMRFSVSAFDPVHLDLNVDIQVKSAQYDPQVVEKALRLALYEYLKLEMRAPGTALFTSQIYKITESITGVENSKVSFFANQLGPVLSQNGNPISRASKDITNRIVSLRPTDRQALFLTSPGAISVMVREYSL